VQVERTDVESALALAQKWYDAGRKEEAEALYRFALGARLDDPRVHIGLADVALQGDRREEALSEAEASWQLLEAGRSRFPVEVRGMMWQTLAEVFAGLGKAARSQQAQMRAEALTGSRVGGRERGGPR
jgi:predicted Zn-dependent protease